MKILTSFLPVLAVFSPVVLSQNVDPLTSSAVGTAKEDVSTAVSQANSFQRKVIPLFISNFICGNFLTAISEKL